MAFGCAGARRVRSSAVDRTRHVRQASRAHPACCSDESGLVRRVR
jgi:hypothetical protein